MTLPTLSARFPHDRGLTLIELMVALTLGLVLLAGLVTLLANVSGARTEIDKSSRQIENGRYAMHLLSDNIRHAGYYGQYFSLPAVPASLPDPCATAAAGLQSGAALPVQGYDAPVATPLSCLPATEYVPGTDILVIRRARTVTEPVDPNPANPIAGLTATRAYIQSNSSATPIIDLGANSGVFTLLQKDPVTGLNTQRADIRQYHVHIYFISPCSAPSCAASTETIPSLKRLELTAAGMSIVPLVEGIENMQFEYGIDTAPTYTVTPTTPNGENASTGYIGDGSPDSFVAAPADTTAWSNVVAVRVFLLARNTEPTAGHIDTKTYTLSTLPAPDEVAIGPLNDNVKRHVFSALVRAVNPGGRRELP